jgi:hypothetical protein
MDNNLSPNQLKVITDHLLDVYSKNYSEHKTNESHYERIDVDGSRFKVGLLPGAEGSVTVMNIKIVRKGNK